MKYPHWQYYKSILNDLEVLSRYVEISQDNYETYSIELTKILLSVCSEVDVVAKLLCASANQIESPDNIKSYQKILLAKFPGLPDVEVSIPKYSISFKPWEEWPQDKTPKWWNDYNKVKHERDKHFRDGNLKNVLFATGGLCVLLSYLHYKNFIAKGLVTPLFMFLDNKYMTGGKVLVVKQYKLPDFRDFIV